MGFKKAERRQAKLKIAITGPSGSGKTLSALRLAKGLGGRIAVIDTENKSASLYADNKEFPIDFDVMEISAPYTNEKFITAINDAVKEKYDIVIIDSLTHQWAGDGGLLSKKEQMDARGGNSFTNWAKMTPEHEKFKAALLQADIHTIGTMRSKTEYALGEKDGGKLSVKKLGAAPIQRDGMEYEFTTVFDIAMNHEAEASKDRTDLFRGKFFKITEKTGEEFRAWINAGSIDSKPVEIKKSLEDEQARISAELSSAESPLAPQWKFGKEERARIEKYIAEYHKKGWDKPTVKKYVADRYKAVIEELNKDDFESLLRTIELVTASEAFFELM